MAKQPTRSLDPPADPAPLSPLHHAALATLTITTERLEHALASLPAALGAPSLAPGDPAGASGGVPITAQFGARPLVQKIIG